MLISAVCGSCSTVADIDPLVTANCFKCGSDDLDVFEGALNPLYPNIKGYPEDMRTQMGNVCLRCNSHMSEPGHGIVHHEACPYYTHDDARLQGLASLHDGAFIDSTDDELRRLKTTYTPASCPKCGKVEGFYKNADYCSNCGHRGPHYQAVFVQRNRPHVDDTEEPEESFAHPNPYAQPHEDDPRHDWMRSHMHGSRAKSDECPSCGSHMDDVMIFNNKGGGQVLKASCSNCGWKGWKQKKSSLHTAVVELTSGEPYGETQTREDLHDGDVFHVADTSIYGVMVSAWPCVLTEQDADDTGMHTFTMSAINDPENQKYKAAFEEAYRLQGLPFPHQGSIDPRHDMDPLHDVRGTSEMGHCSSCLQTFKLGSHNPTDPIPPCPHCGSIATSVAGATSTHVSKLRQITAGILETNPGMPEGFAMALAVQTLERFPHMAAPRPRAEPDEVEDMPHAINRMLQEFQQEHSRTP